MNADAAIRAPLVTAEVDKGDTRLRRAHHVLPLLGLGSGRLRVARGLVHLRAAEVDTHGRNDSHGDE